MGWARPRDRSNQAVGRRTRQCYGYDSTPKCRKVNSAFLHSLSGSAAVPTVLALPVSSRLLHFSRKAHRQKEDGRNLQLLFWSHIRSFYFARKRFFFSWRMSVLLHLSNAISGLVLCPWWEDILQSWLWQVSPKSLSCQMKYTHVWNEYLARWGDR